MKVKNTDKMKKMYIHSKPWDNLKDDDDGIIEVTIRELMPFARYTGCITIDDSDKVTQTKDEKLWRKKHMKGLKRGLQRLFKAPESTIYPWETLKESIEKEGYNPEKWGYITVVSRTKKDGKKQFSIINGNHRVEVLAALYGPDYKLKVQRTSRTTLKGVLTIIPQTLAHVPIIHFPSFIFFMWYLLVPLLITSVIIYIILSIVKDVRQLAQIETHPKKKLTFLYNKAPKLYSLLMNIHYNLTYILSGIVLLLFTIYTFYHYWLEFLIMLGITFLFGFIVSYLIKKFNIETKNIGSLTLNDLITGIKK